ncbi:FAS1-like dehydratase domain-containing protein [Yinghuangia seranimata]|uniref:FAS1-like dehydratase domain-containing protein n=1 Tax=Yinghuangia seranimata TaxID=408067 RepID=UPI00248B9BCF|nr:MaoC family dehydratase N-terminal domain-containing protein [Yinghuangia seranimata]MDI2132450.1 MaoC family dehydratase N-terminal domain-containing protein [Yinghuangia seranimata]
MPLLTDDLRARVGEIRAYTAAEPLSRASIRYYAAAVGDANPLYTDRDRARAVGWADVIAPPTLLCDSNQYLGGTERDADGFAGHSWGIEPPNCRMVRGGNDYVFHRPAYPDDVVTVTWRLADISERTSGAGQEMLIVTSEATFTDQHGTLLLVNTETIIHIALGEVDA